MKTLILLAWRNIWRNPRRTVILMCAMMAGLVGVLVSLGLTYSWLEQIRNNTVRFYEGHVKIVQRGYFDNPIIENSREPPPGLAARLDADPQVRAWADRVAVQALLQTPRRSMVISLVGVDPAREPTVSDVPESLREGTYLDVSEGRAQPILVGRLLAEKLGLSVGKKVVLLSQQYGSDEVGAAAFRVAGIFDTGTGGFDDRYVFVRRDHAQAMLNLGERITETVIMLHRGEESDAVAARLQTGLADGPLEALSWRERLPFVAKTIELTNQMMIPYYAVFYIAMAFGIVNTLLMAIGERTHEIGVMMAIGMPRRILVLLIMLESMLIAMVAIVLGTLLGWGLVLWLGSIGIDLSAIMEGGGYQGMGRVLHPRLEWAGMVTAAAIALAVAAAFSVYPAIRAARLAPVEAIRRIV